MKRSSGQKRSIVDVLNRLKDQLSDFNFVNIGNLTALTNNIQFLFSYVKNALMAILYHKDALQNKLTRLERKIQQNGLQYLLEEGEKDNTNHRLIQLNQKIRSAMLKKEPVIHEREPRKMDFNQETVKTSSQRSEKQQSRYQYSMAINFVKKYLRDKLQEQPTKSLELPKNSIVNLYLQWAEQNTNPIDYKHLSQIQMALTNQVKKYFPGSSHNSRSFKGIQFKEEYRHLVKTDVNSRRQVREYQVAEQSGSEDSPPLPTFPDDYKVQKRSLL